MDKNEFGEYTLPHGYVTEDQWVVTAWDELRNRISDAWHGMDDEDADIIIAAYLSDWLGASSTLSVDDFSDTDGIIEAFEGIYDSEGEARDHMADMWMEGNDVPAQVLPYIDTDRIADDMMLEGWTIATAYDSYEVVIFRS